MYSITELLSNSESVSIDLSIPKKDVETYFRNYYINKTRPIRNLTANEINLVKHYEETRFFSERDIRSFCSDNKIPFEEYVADNWIVPKNMINMPDNEYRIARKYTRYLLEPYLFYKNSTAPRLSLLSKEEIGLLLSNIAVGVSILPGEKINTKTSMDAMDRLLVLYDSLPKNDSASAEVNKKLRKLNPKQLEMAIKKITDEIESEEDNNPLK